jgi:hypothetical protein
MEERKVGTASKVYSHAKDDKQISRLEKASEKIALISLS